MQNALSITLLVLLTSCGGANMMIPTEALVSGAAKLGPVVADASTVKEALVHKSIQNYQDNYAKAFKDSGTKVTFKLIEVKPGIFVSTVSEISSRGGVAMVAPPAEPSQHPVWRSIDNGLSTLAKFGFGYLAVDSIVGGFKAMSENVGPKFYSDAEINSSFNPNGGSQGVWSDKSIETTLEP